MIIGAIEDGIIAKIKTILGDKVRAVDALPASWDDLVLDRILRVTPGAYVSFAGGADATPGGVAPSIDGAWSVAVVTNHASGEKARRRGDTTAAGAYELIEVLVAGLHGHNVTGQGSLIFVRIENLFDDVIDKKGVMVYAIVFRLSMAFDPAVDLASLHPFQSFTQAIEEPAQTPVLKQIVQMPQ
jgi:phage gp37-like protein